MQIAFWSPVHGQTGTTSNTIALSIMTALDYRYKTMVTHTHFDKNSLETTLLDKSYLKGDLFDLTDTGIDALSRFCKLKKLDSEMVNNYATTLIKNRLDLLIGTFSTHRELYMQNMSDVIDQIITAVKECYELVMIDVSSGMGELTKRIIDKSDLNVISLCQNCHVLDEYFDNYRNDFEGKKIIYLISRYDANSRINIKMIKKKYGIKETILPIPYCVEFADSMSYGRAVEFFIKERNCSEQDINFDFIQGIREACEKMFITMGVDYSYKCEIGM
ncbi:MAG TPA: hypothetical protein VHT34_05780 [Clostridia bacterium]|nr:hypothetical protein [Clostridia bacterium]